MNKKSNKTIFHFLAVETIVNCIASVIPNSNRTIPGSNPSYYRTK